jgi:hypothetical protein
MERFCTRCNRNITNHCGSGCPYCDSVGIKGTAARQILEQEGQERKRIMGLDFLKTKTFRVPVLTWLAIGVAILLGVLMVDYAVSGYILIIYLWLCIGLVIGLKRCHDSRIINWWRTHI